MIYSENAYNPLKILIVEDQLIIAAELSAALKNFSYEVVGIANTTAKAVSLTKEKSPDIILMDIMLKEGDDGIETALKIKTFADLPIIFITAYSDKSTIERVKSVGPSGYLIKPFNHNELYSAIETSYYKHNIEKKLKESEERYRRLIEGSPDISYRFSTKRGAIFWSLSIEKVLGFKVDEYLSDPFKWYNSIVDEDKHIADEAIQKGIDGDYFEVEYRMLHANGNIIWVNDRFIGKSIEKDEIVIDGLASDVTEKKLASEALMQNEKRFRSLFNNVANISVQGYTAEGNVIYWNKASEKIYGYTEEEALGKSLLDLIIPPFMREGVKEAVAQMVKTGEAIPAEELHLMKKDGSLFPLFSNHTIIDIPGKGKELFCLDIDLTELKEKERALLENKKKLKLAEKIARIGYFEIDLQTNQTKWSDEIYNLLGINKEDGTRSIPQLIEIAHPNDRSFFENEFKTAFENKINCENVFRIIKENGTTATLHGIWNFAKDDDTGHFKMFGTFQDITERIKYEEKLRESEDRWQFALEGANDGVWDWNVPTSEIYFSKKWKEMLGYEGEEIEPNLDSWKNLIHPNDAEETLFRAKEFIEGKLEIYQSEHRLRCKNGSYKWILDRGKVIKRDEQGNPLRAVGTHTDIHERKMTELLMDARIRLNEYSINHTLDELIQKVLDELEILTESKIGFFHYVEEDQRTLRLEMWSTNTISNMCKLEAKGKHYDIDIAGVWTDCAKERKPVIHNDYQNLKHKKGYPEGHSHVIRELGLPVIRDGKIKAILGIGNKETDYNENDIQTVSLLADLAWDITERKRAEEKLKENEAKYRLLVENQRDVVVKVDAEGNFLYVSPSYCKVFGKSGDELLGKSFFPLGHPDDIAVIENEMKKLYLPPYSCQVEQRAITINGWRWFSWAYTAEFDENGKVATIIGVGRDITEKKLAEEELLESRNKITSLISAAPVGIGLVKNRIILEVNDTFCVMMGYSREEIMNQNSRILYQTDDEFKRAGEVKYKMIAEKGVGFVETRWVKKDGKIIDILLSSALIDSNDPSKGATFTAQDITEKKHSEEILQASEEKHRRLFETMVQGVVYQNADGQIISANPAAEKILGLSLDQMMGKTSMDPGWKTIHEDGTNFPGEDHPAMRALRSGKIEHSFLGVINQKNNLYSWISVTATPLFKNSEDKPYQVYATIEDLTEIKLAQRELSESVRKYKQLFELNHDGIAVIQINDHGVPDKFLEVNNSAASMLGYTIEEMMCIPPHAIEIDVNEEKLAFRQSELENKSIVTFETQLLHKNGNIIDAEFVVQLLSYEGKLALFNIVRDITERKILEEKQKTVDKVFNHSIDMLCIAGFDGYFKVLNPAWEKTLGWSTQELLSSPWNQFVYPDDIESTNNVKSIIVDGQEIYQFENRYICKDGKVKWLSWNSFPYPQENIMFGVARDITEKRIAEDKLKQSEERFSKAFRISPDLININRLSDGKYISINEGFTKTTGYTEEDVIGKTSLELDIWVNESERNKLVEGLLKDGLVDNLETQFRMKNGNIVTGLMSASLIELNGEKHIISITRDISERIEIEKAMRESEAKFRSLFENAVMGIYRTTPEGSVIMANPALLKMLGYNSFEELSNLNIEEGYVTDNMRNEFKKIIEKNGFIEGFESKWFKKDDSITYMRESAKVIKDENNLPLYYEGTVEDITIRKLAEEALLEEQYRINTLMESITEAIYFKDLECKFIGLNKAQAQRFGLTDISLAIGKSDFDFFSKVHAQKAFDDEQKILKTGQPIVDVEEKEVWPDGRVSWVSTTKMPLKDYAGKIIGTFGISKIITDRKLAEEALRESEAKFRSYIEHSPVSIFIVDAQGKYIEVNKSACNLMGYSEEELLNLSIKDIVSPNGMVTAFEHFKQVRTIGFASSEILHLHKSGREFWAILTAVKISDNCFMGHAIDITERIEYENKLKENEERFRGIIDASIDGFWVATTDGIIQEVNSAYCSMTGFSEDQIVNKHISVFDAIEDREDVLTHIEKIIELGYDRFKSKHICADGSNILVEISVYFLLKQNKLLIFVRNITDRENAINALLESEDRYRKVVDNSPDGIAIHQNGKFVFANASALKIIGADSFDQLSKVGIFDVVHPDYRTIAMERIQDMALHNTVAPPRSEKLLRMDGSEIDVEIISTPFVFSGQKAFQVIVRDITDKKKAENLILMQRDLNNQLIKVSTLQSATEIIFKFAKKIDNITAGGIYLTDERGGLTLFDSFNLSKKTIKEIQKYDADSIQLKMVAQGDPIYISYNKDEYALKKSVAGRTILAVAAIPLRKDNKVVGVLNLASEKVYEFSENQKQLIEAFASQIGSYLNRILIEDEVKKSEEKYRSFFESDLTADFKSTIEGELLECNEAYVKMFEFDSKEHALRTNTSELYLEQYQRVERFSKLRKHKKLEQLQAKMKTIKGREIYILQNMLGEFDKKGKLIGASGYIFDITSIKLAEFALKESERRYRELFDSMQDGFALHELILSEEGKPIDYKFLAVNKAFEKMTGLNKNDLIGKSVLKVMPNTESYWIEKYGKVALGGKPLRYENYARELNKYYRVLAYSPEKMKFAVIMEDVTDIRIKEEKIKQLSVAVEQSPVSVIITDLDGVIVYVNKMFCKTTGYTYKEALGRNPRILKSGNMSKSEYSEMWNTITNGKSWSGIFNNKKKNGELFFESAKISPMLDSSGKPTHFIAVKEDITERIKIETELEHHRTNLELLVAQRTKELDSANKKLQMEIAKEKEFEMVLQQALDREKELNDLKTKFISTTSHEFRTPLTSVLSSAELLKLYGRKWPDEKYNHHTDKIVSSVETLTRMLDDVLTISRSESGKIHFKPEKINLRKVCEEIVEETSAHGSKNHNFIFKFRSRKNEFILDIKLLRFIIVNLLSNAYKYSPEGGTVTFEVSTKRNKILFSITDQGIGIPANELKNLFQPFHRAKNAMELPGTGLGLSIVKRAVDLHRGEILLRSEIGKGTNFIVELPMEKESIK